MTENMKPSNLCDVTLPVGWECARFRKLFSFGKGLSITKEDLVDEGVPVISYGQVHSKANTGTAIHESLIRFVPESYLKTDKQALTQEGNFIFADTSEDLSGVGNCAFVNTTETLFAGYHSIIARPKETNMHPKYFAYQFLTDIWRDQIRAKVMGVKVFSISQKLLRDTTVFIPPLQEQKAIAKLLDIKCAKIDSMIADIEKQIETLQKYKKSLITEAVTKGLDRSAPMKDSGIEWIGCIPAEWDCKKLKYIISESLQYGANEAGDDYREDYPRYIRITDITEENTLKEEGKLSLPPDIAAPYILRDGDILFARSGATVGKTFFYTTNCGLAAFAGYLIRARVNPSMALPRFVYYSTLGVGYENWKNTVFTQATIQNIGADKYAQFFVTLPKLTEQSRIVEYLDEKCAKIDDIIKNKQQQLLTVQQHKKSLIYEYVTGKKRVTEVN